MDINKVLEKTKLISYIVGASLAAVAGIYFLVISDLGLKNKATWLMISVLLSFGSSIAFFFSETRRDKPILVFFLKGVGLLLAVGFLIYLFKFEQSIILSTAEMLSFLLYKKKRGLLPAECFSNFQKSFQIMHLL